VTTLSTVTALLVAADDGDGQLFLGEDFFPWMVLAFGAAMVVGNALALARPREGERPPVARAAAMIVVGLVAAAWGLASLL
jgi:hypothetical protein